MEIKSHLFEMMQFYFLHSVLLFLYLLVLLRPNFLPPPQKKKIKVCLVFPYTINNHELTHQRLCVSKTLR